MQNDLGFRMRRFVASGVTMVFAVLSNQAAAQAYLYDLLDKPAYAKSWKALFAGEKPVDPWLARYAKTRNGPATPGKPVRIGETDFQINTVCKTHSCSEHEFHVAFNADGSRAWGLLLDQGRPERFFGRPDEEMKKALRAAGAR